MRVGDLLSLYHYLLSCADSSRLQPIDSVDARKGGSLFGKMGRGEERRSGMDEDGFNIPCVFAFLLNLFLSVRSERPYPEAFRYDEKRREKDLYHALYNFVFFFCTVGYAK